MVTLQTVFLSLLVFFCILFLWVGVYINRKERSTPSSAEQEHLSSRNLGVFPLTCSLLATQIGGGTIIGASDAAFNYGWKSLMFPMGYFLGFLVLGFGYGKKLRNMNIGTISEIFEKRYSSVFLRKYSSLISIISLFLILVAISVAGLKLFYALGYTNPIYFVALWFVIITYIISGGLTAVVWTDVIQMAFIIFSFGMVAIFTETKDFVPTKSVPMSELSAQKYLGWLFVPFLYMLVEQDMGQRCFAAKNGRTITISSFLTAGFFAAIASFPIYFGIVAAQSGYLADANESVLMGFVQQNNSPVISGIFAVGLLMAIISTADSLLNSITANIVLDFFPESKDSEKSSHKSKWITLIVGFASVLLSLYFTEIIELILFAYQALATIFVIPIFLSIIGPEKYINKESALFSVAIASICFVLTSATAYTSLVRPVITIISAGLTYLLVFLKTNSSLQEKV